MILTEISVEAPVGNLLGIFSKDAGSVLVGVLFQKEEEREEEVKNVFRLIDYLTNYSQQDDNCFGKFPTTF